MPCNFVVFIAVFGMQPSDLYGRLWYCNSGFAWQFLLWLNRCSGRCLQRLLWQLLDDTTEGQEGRMDCQDVVIRCHVFTPLLTMVRAEVTMAGVETQDARRFAVVPHPVQVP